MKNKLVFLGTGASMGVPVIGCSCRVCQTERRMRPSVLLHVDGKQFLIDAGPDFYAQAIKYQIKHLDGLLLTHTHQDHIAGIDDLRIYAFLQKKPVPCLLSDDAHQDLQTRYHYLFLQGKGPKLDCRILDRDYGDLVFEGLPVNHFHYWQAGMKVKGYRFGDLAYVTDIQRYDDEVVRQLQGVKTLIVSALRYQESPVHFNVPEAIAFAKKVGAEKTYLTHIAHEMAHDTVNRDLPDGVQLAYDGQEVAFG